MREIKDQGQGWNVMYDGILRITMPEGARLIGFADDVAIVVTAKKLADAERICNEAGKQASAGSTPRDSPWQRTKLKQS